MLFLISPDRSISNICLSKRFVKSYIVKLGFFNKYAALKIAIKFSFMLQVFITELTLL